MTENQQKNDIQSIDGQLLNRGCALGTTFNTGQKVLVCGRCKLSQFDWLKDYENQEVKGEVRLAEVRFKNDRKDYFTYPEDLELEVGEFVAVETAIGHDIGIVTLLGEIVKRQMKRKRFRTPLEEMKKIYRRARVNDVEKFLSAIKLEDSTLARTRTIIDNLGLEMKRRWLPDHRGRGYSCCYPGSRWLADTSCAPRPAYRPDQLEPDRVEGLQG